MESVVITMCIYIRCDGDVAVAHEFFGHIDGDAGLLQIGAEGMAQTVEGEIFGNGVLDDLVPVKGGAHVHVQLEAEGEPLTVYLVIVHDGAVLFGKDERERISLLLQKQRAKGGLNGNVPDTCICLWPLQIPGAAFFCRANVYLISLEVHIGPGEGGRFPGADAGVKQSKDP